MKKKHEKQSSKLTPRGRGSRESKQFENYSWHMRADGRCSFSDLPIKRVLSVYLFYSAHRNSKIHLCTGEDLNPRPLVDNPTC